MMPGQGDLVQLKIMVDSFMIKRAYSVQMTYDVTDAEKQQAEKALLFFNHTIKLLELASEHLNIMKTPFKSNPEMDSKSLLNARSAIRRFRDQSISNFNDFKKEAFKCVNAMQEFSSDTQTIKLIKSFITSIDDLENKVNNFVDLFDDLEDKEFSKKIIESIESIQNQCEDVDEIVDDRIKSHIQSNILAKSWVDFVSEDLQVKVEKKTPLMLELFNDRQDQLNEVIKEKKQID
jgi:hypothetical protein